MTAAPTPERGRPFPPIAPERTTTLEAGVASERWEVRESGIDDVPAAAAAVAELLVELGGRVPDAAALEAEARALVSEPGVGILLVATTAYETVGVLAASWGRALHVPGRYLTLQDLWVRREWRSAGVGARLVDALADRAAAAGAPRIEVGLPRESFEAIRATERFYLANGFQPLGPRMRRLVR
jgi:GNAT superfamily N-acetyltransferase